MNPLQILNELEEELSYVSLSPRSEADRILSHITRKPIHRLVIDGTVLSCKDKQLVEDIVEKRVKFRVPLQYIIESVNFRGIELYIREGVFIPRAETELVVDTALDILSKDSTYMLDLGTGSGAISIAVAIEKKELEIFAVDNSPSAIEVSKVNLRNHNIKNVYLIMGDWLTMFEPRPFFDLIISNPPYIKEGEWDHLQEEVKKEPKTALLGGHDGLEYIIPLIEEGYRLLKENGNIIFEVSPTIVSDCVKLAVQKEFQVEVKKDINGLDRVLILKKCGN